MRAPGRLCPPPIGELQTHRGCYRGQARVDVRWWTRDDHGGWRPTHRGLSLPPEQWEALWPLIQEKIAQEGPD